MFTQDNVLEWSDMFTQDNVLEWSDMFTQDLFHLIKKIACSFLDTAEIFLIRFAGLWC